MRSTRNRRRRGAQRRLGSLAVSLGIAAVLTGAGVSAVPSVSVSPPAATTVSSGTVVASYTLGSGSAISFDSALAGLGLGDVVYRYVDVLSSGTLPTTNLTYQLCLTGPDCTMSLTANPADVGFLVRGANGLTFTLTSCSIDFNRVTHTCPGTPSTLIAATAARTLGTATALPGTALAPAGRLRLQMRWALPDAGDSNYLGKTATLVHTVVATQRTATTTGG